MTLSSIVENISVEIWKWMYRAQKIPHGTAQETGLTSYLLYKIEDGYNSSSIKNTAFILTFQNTHVPEKVSGADFLFLLYCSQCGFQRLHLVQAKKLYNNGRTLNSPCANRYNAFNHIVNGKQQWSVLTNYAKSKGYSPYYLFYNTDFKGSNHINNGCNCPQLRNYSAIDSQFRNNNEEIFGTLFTEANDLHPFLTTRPKFSDIVACKSTKTLQEYLRHTCCRSNINPNQFPRGNQKPRGNNGQSVSKNTGKNTGSRGDEMLNRSENRNLNDFKETMGAKLDSQSKNLIDKIENIEIKEIIRTACLNNEIGLPLLFLSLNMEEN